jgi:hypothetical protein
VHENDAQYESNISSEGQLIHHGSGNFRKSAYTGISITCGGSRLPAVNMISRNLPHCSRRREIRNATNEAKNRTPSTAGTAMISVFR